MADYKTRQFFGAAQTVIDSAVDIAAGNFGAAGTAFDNTTDSAVPYATHAVVYIQMPDWAAAPVAGTSVELWGLMQDIDSTTDESDAPATSVQGGAHFLGACIIAAADAVQRREFVISLEGIRKFVPYIRNGTAQNMNNDAGTNLVVKITPFCYGVTA
jgi:hypothetical protein